MGLPLGSQCASLWTLSKENVREKLYIYINNVLLGDLLLGDFCWAQTKIALECWTGDFCLRPTKIAQQKIAQQDIVYICIYI